MSSSMACELPPHTPVELIELLQYVLGEFSLTFVHEGQRYSISTASATTTAMSVTSTPVAPSQTSSYPLSPKSSNLSLSSYPLSPPSYSLSPSSFSLSPTFSYPLSPIADSEEALCIDPVLTSPSPRRKLASKKRHEDNLLQELEQDELFRGVDMTPELSRDLKDLYVWVTSVGFSDMKLMARVLTAEMSPRRRIRYPFRKGVPPPGEWPTTVPYRDTNHVSVHDRAVLIVWNLINPRNPLRSYEEASASMPPTMRQEVLAKALAIRHTLASKCN